MQRIFTGSVGSILAIITVINNGFISGMAVGWTAAAIPKIKRGETKIVLSLEQASIAVTLFYFGQVIATIPFSYLDNAFGKRRAMQMGIHFTIAGWLIIYFVEDQIGLYTGRFLLGIWISFSTLSTTPYLAEVVPPKRRGFILSFSTILFLFGALIESVLGIFLTYSGLTLANGAITLLQLFLLLLIPESPYFYMKHNQIQKAASNFEWFRGKNTEDFEKAVSFVNMQMKMKTRFIDICRYPVSRNAFIFALILISFQRISAAIPLISYTAFILPESFIASEKSPMIFFGIAMISVLISGTKVDKWGRRKLLIASALGSFLFSACSTVWFILDEKTSINLKGYSWIPLISFSGEYAFFTVGIYYIPTIITSELFPINIKAKALSLIQIAQLSLITINVRVFIIFKKNNWTFAMFIAYCITLGISCWYFTSMYDTKGKTLEEIHEHFARKGRRKSSAAMNVLPTQQVNREVKKKSPQVASAAKR